jgi:uncharacterized protein YbjQ (UPF0145 family)
MIITTTEDLPGRRIVKVLGLARGSTVRTRHIGHDVTAVIRNVAGGDIHEYTKLLAESREQSIDRMVEDAERMGANAVVGMRFSTSMVMAGAAETMCYGTAVVSENEST